MSKYLPPKRFDVGRLEIPGAVLWIGLGLAYGFLEPDPENRLAALSYLTMGFGAWVFLVHGRRMVTTAGIFSLCAAVFVGYPGIYWLTNGNDVGYIADAVTAGYFCLVAMYYIFWRRMKPPTLGPVKRSTVRGAGMIGVLLMIVGAVAARAGVGSSLAAPAAFAGVVLVSAAFVIGGRRGFKLWAMMVSGAAALFYVQFVFVGFGRLVLSAMAFSVLFILTIRFRTYWIKALTLVAIPPAMMYLVDQREEFGVETFGQALDGIGSIVAPLEQFAVIFRDLEMVTLAWGHTFYAGAVTLIPSAIWPDKPEGFGLVLARFYEPAFADVGGTYAALTHGEFIYNFGAFGLPIMVIVLGWLIRRLDLGFFQAVARGASSRRALLAIVAFAIIAGGMSDILWGGFHLFMGRAGIRLLIVFLIVLTWGGLAHRVLMPRRRSPAVRPATLPARGASVSARR
ncbi:hypothetical protein [Paeniglutamicibacter gangotriensis]|uniref:Uncharacterized protein n=1 Tax=Paeniglutamicibacter gangotriensis Lz1y TaxID=1276920 RepID=M7N982_9MICC|nr:hypothetical protein [Paeniglutamicibacter gangotriensis]EMQ98334.1 hypothetical protein ADIAG_02352 [Paeniglutamicibacter gangotriensis Lz1y]